MKAGPFDIELVHVTHSIPDAAAVALGTPQGKILFTGDYRFDQTPVDGRPADFRRLVRLGEEGVLLLCGDSTNADRHGIAPSESSVGPALHDVFRGCEGRIVVTSFASNIHRVQQVITAAEDLGRHVLLLGRSMVKNVKIGRELGLIRAKSGTIIEPKGLSGLRDDRVVIMTTGSQGEPLAALQRMASQEHRQVHLRAGDTVVFSANSIPGNERAVEETIDRLARLGCKVVTAKDAPIHTSGHGYREEIKMMINLVQPEHVMPFHGDARRQRLHAELAEMVGIPRERIFVGENGLPLDFTAAGPAFGAPVQAGMTLVDNLDVGDLTTAALRDRSALSQDGVVFIVATVSQQDGDTL
ncbi:MAG: ribonuclease J, partial [Myxococcales bacterium]